MKFFLIVLFFNFHHCFPINIHDKTIDDETTATIDSEDVTNVSIAFPTTNLTTHTLIKVTKVIEDSTITYKETTTILTVDDTMKNDSNKTFSEEITKIFENSTTKQNEEKLLKTEIFTSTSESQNITFQTDLQSFTINTDLPNIVSSTASQNITSIMNLQNSSSEIIENLNIELKNVKFLFFVSSSALASALIIAIGIIIAILCFCKRNTIIKVNGKISNENEVENIVEKFNKKKIVRKVVDDLEFDDEF